MNLRVWHVPQVPGKPFYIPVNDIKEAKKVIDILAAYDLFQLENNIKPDFCNVSGVQQWDEQENEWYDWDIETEDDYFDSVDEYFENDEEMRRFSKKLFSQLKGKEKNDRYITTGIWRYGTRCL